MSAENTFELELTSMAHGGSAIGRHDGRTIFVPYTLPGERIIARIVQDRGRFAIAEVVKIVSPSPQRVEPRCPYFGPGLCGGCQLQHIDYAAQLELKQSVVKDQMARIGGFQEITVLPMLASPDEYDYRTHVTLHALKDGQLGFVSTDDDNLIVIDECHIIRPPLQELLNVIDFAGFEALDRVRLQVGSEEDDLMIGLSTVDDEVPELEVDFPASISFLSSEKPPQPLIGKPSVNYRVKDRDFMVRAGGFFQVNLQQAEKLVDLVLERLDLQGTERVLDLYSGVGLFSAFIAERAAWVTGVEAYAPAVEDAAENLSAFENIDLFEGAVEEVLSQLEGSYDAVVLDPPRAGLDGVVVDALVALAPAKIVYVSCDLATFARDAKRLAAQGYRLHEIQPVDMFPQTASIELVSLFTRE
ncbi:MAG: class I SAM-dependent RNA methyltransferase [Anaerolineae bacterium]|nr:class I SAM-dependent RNA methyltransferase [Anaerolineae bacterium]